MPVIKKRQVTKVLAAVVVLALLGGCSVQPNKATLPDTFISVPVIEPAMVTQNELKQAAHIPQDRYDDAIRIEKLPQEALQPVTKLIDPKIGDRTDFFINYDLNNDFRPMPATLRQISENALWWIADNAAVTDEDLVFVAENFESVTFQINRLVYGTENQPGIDGENRIQFLFVDMPEWEGFYGYFSTTNSYPQGMEPYSNEKDMIVINIGSASFDSLAFAGELGHEFAHLIQWSVDPNEDLWMNEALAELSAFLVVSPPPGTLMEDPNQQVFASMPYIQLTSRPEGTPEEDPYAVYAHYGGEKLFTVYLLDRFGPQFVKDLIGNQEAGVRALDQELGKLNPPLTFNDVYADWILANLLNQPNHPEGRFGYAEVQTLLPSIILVNLFDGEPLEGYMPPYATFYYELRAIDKININFDGASMARLTPADPVDGEYAWYSNRGDQTAFTLTRSFDLTNVNTATLNYSVWFELEENFDYGYVLVSADEGKTWDVLPTKHGRAENLGDGAYGIAYTGESTGWKNESLDLTGYAGKNIWIRFLVNTDLATNRDGVMLDNIAIPEIGFFDGAENADGGWTAQGFVRSANVVPVDWIVWLVKVNTDPDLQDEVIRLELDDLRAGSIEVDGFGERFDFAALVVSPTAPTTSMSIDYELSITGK